ncbi:MAG: signal peptidase [Actinomycetota bacterium]|nr:signal peptidase [Actinomycetota bacterium]
MLFVLAVVALGIYLLDQGAKYLIVKNLVAGQQVNVLGTFLQVHIVQNSGAAFSIGTGMTWVFSIVAAAVAVFIILYARRIRSYGWGILFGLLLGGTLGNLSDRLFRQPRFGEGHVVDFIQVFGFPAIFNIADSAICISMVLFIILTIRGVGLDGKRVARKAAVSETAATDPATISSTDATTAGSEPRAADSEK